MGDGVIVTEARIVERVQAGAPVERAGMGVGEGITWTFVSILWYAIIRFAIVGFLALVWLGAPRTPEAALAWMWVGTPAACTLAAFLTLQTNTNNGALHRIQTIVVFASALIFHINLGIGSPFVSAASGSEWAIAWLFQAVAVLAGAGIGLVVVKRRRARRERRTPALPVSV
jgi:hypothetical protein